MPPSQSTFSKMNTKRGDEDRKKAPNLAILPLSELSLILMWCYKIHRDKMKWFYLLTRFQGKLKKNTKL